MMVQGMSDGHSLTVETQSLKISAQKATNVWYLSK